MTRRLILGFLLVASLSGALSAYSSIFVGFSGLNTMSSVFLNFSVTSNNYYTVLNAARTSIFAGLTDVVNTMNTTYTAQLSTFGANKAMLQGVLQGLPLFNSTLQQYGTTQIDSAIAMDLNQVGMNVKSSMDTVCTNFGSILSSLSSPASDNCVAANNASMISLPNSMAALGTCLQMEIGMVQPMLPPISGSTAAAKKNFIGINSQRQICQNSSPNCILLYYATMGLETQLPLNDLMTLQQLVAPLQTDANMRNQYCNNLVQSSIQDAMANIQNSIMACMNQTMTT